MQQTYQLADLQNWEAHATPSEPPVLLGVVGDPVEHSLSPQMQNAALAASGLTMRYARFRIAAEELPEALRLMREHDFVGCNLTAPHKIAALPLLDEVDDRARKIGAVNTVVFRGGQLVRLQH